MKFLIVGDLHGQKPRIHYKDFDAIIVPGDICGDTILRPLTNKWLKTLGKSKSLTWSEYMDKYLGKKGLKDAKKKNLAIGNRIMKYLDSFGVPVYFVPGNWDQSYGKSRIKHRGKNFYNYASQILDQHMAKHSNPKLLKGCKNVVDLQFGLAKETDCNLIGYGLSSYPEFQKQECKESFNKEEFGKLKRKYSRLVGRLSKLYAKRDKKKPTLFLSHNVPYNTKLDKIIKPGTSVHGLHYGSTVARDFILKHKPLVCVGGHMHEHFGKCKLGSTTVVNAGFGRHVNVLLEIKNKKIKKLSFHRGK